MKQLYESPAVARLIIFLFLFGLVTLCNQVIISIGGQNFIFFFDVLLVPLIVKSFLFFRDKIKGDVN